MRTERHIEEFEGKDSEFEAEARNPEIYSFWETRPSRTKQVKVKIRVPGKREGTTDIGARYLVSALRRRKRKSSGMRQMINTNRD